MGGGTVQVWGDGVDVGPDPANLKWKLKPVAGEPDTFYIIHHKWHKFLDSHGEAVTLWGDGVKVGSDPDNIKWRFEPVDGIKNAYYLIHKATDKFLDTHGVDTGFVKLWGEWPDTGADPRNLQWQFQQR